MAPTAWAGSHATHLACDNFVETRLDLRAAGQADLDVLLVDAKRGTVALGDGDNHLTWVAESNNSSSGNTMTVTTGSGNNTISLTTAALSALDDAHKLGNGTLYNPGYDGHLSVADITLGAGVSTITTAGAVRLVLQGGAGYAKAGGGSGADTFTVGTGGGDFTGGSGRDLFILGRGAGAATIEDFTSGQDQLKPVGGLTQSGAATKLTTLNGASGLLVTYDTAGDSVFLSHVSKLGSTEVVFA